MPQIKSQMKRIKVAEKQRLRNKSVKSALKTYISNFDRAMAEGNKELCNEALAKAVKNLDKAVSKGIIHKNMAANKKSKLMQKFNAMPEEKVKVEAPVTEAPEEKKVAKKAGAKKKTAAKKTATAKKTTKTKTTEEKAKTPRKRAAVKKTTKKEE